MNGTQIRILEASTIVIARSGIRGLRINDIAREAGISPGLIYYHFVDRAGLLDATLGHINCRANNFSRNLTGHDTGYRQLLLDEIQDDAEVRRDSVAWNELRSTAVFETDLQVPLERSTAEWNQTIAVALALPLPGGTGVAVATGSPSAIAPTTATNTNTNTAEILTSLVEGLSSRWLSGSLTTERARVLLSSAIDALSPASASQAMSASPAPSASPVPSASQAMSASPAPSASPTWSPTAPPATLPKD